MLLRHESVGTILSGFLVLKVTHDIFSHAILLLAQSSLSFDYLIARDKAPAHRTGSHPWRTFGPRSGSAKGGKTTLGRLPSKFSLEGIFAVYPPKPRVVAHIKTCKQSYSQDLNLANAHLFSQNWSHYKKLNSRSADLAKNCFILLYAPRTYPYVT